MKERKEKEFIPVMLTPFKENGVIDFEGLTELTEFYIHAGAKGLFSNCQSSEMYALDNEERLRVIRHVLVVADNRVPVVAVGNFGKTIQQQADFIKRVYDTGVKAVIAVTGLIAEENESNDIFNERVSELLYLTANIPMGFYECPDPYKKVLTEEQLKKFVATGKIIYHKDTCLDIEMVRKKIAATHAYPSFGLYDAYAVNAVDSLRAGAAGLSCVQGNFFPELIVWLCDNFDNADAAAEVAKTQEFLSDHMEVVHHAYPAVAKYYLQKRGLPISTFTRTPCDALSSPVKQKVDHLFDEYKKLKEEIALQLL